MRTVVIVVRNLGARWLGAYGNEWVATPNLDALAAAGTVYEQHFTTNLQMPTVPYPVVEVATLQDAIAKLDATTDAMIVCSDLVPPWAVRDGIFETYSEGIDDTLTPWCEELPATLDEADWDRLHFTFAAMVARLDAAFGKLIATLDATPTRMVFTSDVGFSLGEHNVVGPADTHLHEELVHLPLIVRNPQGANAGERVEGLTTSAELTGLLYGDAVNASRVVSRVGRHTAVRTPEWTLLHDGETFKLFRRPSDPWEMNDVAREFPEVIETLHAS